MIKILSYLNVSHHHHHHHHHHHYHHHHLIKLISRLLLQRLSSAVHRSASQMLRVNNVIKKLIRLAESTKVSTASRGNWRTTKSLRCLAAGHSFQAPDTAIEKVSSAAHRRVPTDREVSWLRGPAVEHRSLAGVLSLSCVRPVADG